MTFRKDSALFWNTCMTSNGNFYTANMTENRKRPREDDTCEFMPLSKRINNLHINNSLAHASHSHVPESSQMNGLIPENGVASPGSSSGSDRRPSYDPGINSSDSSYYFDNKLLFELHMEKIQRSGLHDEEGEMNFAAFSAVGTAGTHFVTTGGQLPVAKLQQNNGNALSQVVGMVGMEGGVQYVRAIDGSTMQAPQLISVPIALPGSKPGDPQQTVQIQVLNPNMLQAQQQPKYQMQIPIQGFQQGGAVLTVQYSPDASDGSGLQLVGQNNLSESGLQVLAAMPQEMLIQQTQTDDKSQIQHNVHQVFVTPSQQIIINNPGDNKTLNNNTSSNNNNENHDTIIIKEECDDIGINDDESSQGTETSENTPWAISSSQQDLVKYLNSLPPQQTQALPLSLQQFLKLNPSNSSDVRKTEPMEIEVEVEEKKDDDAVAEAIIGEDGTVRIHSKKKKKYKKKPPKPARPKPGQVVIATAADGTPIFCCPECQMAYPEKEQLEIHLVVHKIERRFICGICGAGLKRKEHLERHKLGHNPERPFVCGVCRKGFKRREHLNLHTVMHSGVKTEMCTECGKGFYRKDHLRKHTRSHENKRARDEANADNNALFEVKNPPSNAIGNNTILPEITIHVPTSANVQVPVQINIPQHVVTSLAAAQQQAQQQGDSQAQLEALLAHHS